MLFLNCRSSLLHVLQARGNEYTVGEIANAVDGPIEIECLHLYTNEVDVCDDRTVASSPTHLMRLSQRIRRSMTRAAEETI